MFCIASHNIDLVCPSHCSHSSVMCLVKLCLCMRARVCVCVCLCVQEIADEFSHTLLHGVQLAKALPAGSPSAAAARPLPPKPVAGLCISYIV